MRKALVILALAFGLALFSSLSEAHKPLRPTPTRPGAGVPQPTVPPCWVALSINRCP
jgi:hypothetical protein